MLFTDLLEEQKFCSQINDEQKRNRAVANLLGIKVALDFFKNSGLPATTDSAAHKIKFLLQELDIADIYIGDIRLDVRLSLSQDEYLIPKKHYENNITPDLYMLVFYDNSTGEAKLTGFISPDDVNKTIQDEYYYIISKKEITPFEQTDKLFDSLQTKARTNLPLNVKKKILLYLDNQLADKKEFFNEIINCKKALKLFTEFVDAEDVLRNTSFEFAVKMATQTTEELPIKTILPLDIDASEETLKIEPIEKTIIEDIDLGFADGLTPTKKESEVFDEIIDETIETVEVTEIIEEKIEIVEEVIVTEETYLNEEVEALELVEDTIIENVEEVQTYEVEQTELQKEMEEIPSLELNETIEEIVMDDEELPAYEITDEEENEEISEFMASTEDAQEKVILDLDQINDSDESSEIEINSEEVEVVENLLDFVDSEEDDETPALDNVTNGTIEEKTVIEELDEEPEDEIIENVEDEIIEDIIEESSIEELDDEPVVEIIEDSENEIVEDIIEEDVIEEFDEEPAIEIIEDSENEIIEDIIEEDVIEELDDEPDVEIIEDSEDEIIENIIEEDVIEEFDEEPAIEIIEDSEDEIVENIIEEDIIEELGEENDVEIFEEDAVEELEELESEEALLPELELNNTEDISLQEENDIEEFDIEVEPIELESDKNLTFNEFADGMEKVEEENSDNDNDDEPTSSDMDKYDNLDENYIPDFAAGDFKLEGEEEQEELIPLENTDNDDSFELSGKSEVEEEIKETTEENKELGIDLQATMEGFVNTMAPEEAINTPAIEESKPVEQTETVNDDSELEAISEADTEETPQEEINNKNIMAAPSQKQATANVGISELYEAPENNITEQIIEEEPQVAYAYNQKKKKGNGGNGAAAVLLLLLALAGGFGYMYKDTILEKFFGGSSTPAESVPNELATPEEPAMIHEKKIPKKKKETKKEVTETTTEDILKDIEEPVQLMDSSVSVSNLSVECSVPSTMLNSHSKRFIVKLSKRVQLQLRNALLLSGEQPLANKIDVNLTVNNDNVSFERITSSSGSKKVDTMTQSTIENILKNTTPYAGTFGQNNGTIKLIVKF